MREILFRGKRVDNGEWAEGYLIQKGGKTFIARYPYFTGKVHETSWLEFCFGGFIEVIPETVGQYTGLTDKNGKKIFEGDIVNCLDYLGEVYYDADGCFDLRDNTNEMRGDFIGTCHCLEVIGNIHDNPELLEVDK